MQSPLLRPRAKSLPVLKAPAEGILSVRRRPTPNPLTTGVVLPTLSVKELPQALELSAELPGIEPSDIKLSYHKNLLFLNLVKKDPEEASNAALGEFSEVFRLPQDTDRSRIKTRYEDGKFIVSIPLGESPSTPS